jgi:hypothetical protein
MHKVKGEGKEEESGPGSLYTERNLQPLHHYGRSFGDEIHRAERQPRGVGCWRVWCAMGYPRVRFIQRGSEWSNGRGTNLDLLL